MYIDTCMYLLVHVAYCFGVKRQNPPNFTSYARTTKLQVRPVLRASTASLCKGKEKSRLFSIETVNNWTSMVRLCIDWEISVKQK